MDEPPCFLAENKILFGSFNSQIQVTLLIAYFSNVLLLSSDEQFISENGSESPIP
jgi:hypothetical protein